MVCLTVMALLTISTCMMSLRSTGALDGEGAIGSPLTFWSQDTDGDNLYDLLWVNVSFDATVQDGFRFDLRFNDSANMTQIAHIVNDTYLLPGSHVIPMLLDGCYFNCTWKWSGPFVASVKVFNEPGRMLAWTSATSPAYLDSDFERPPVTASKPYGDRGVDLDVPPDGQFNQLRISVSVNFTEPGAYMLSVFVSSPVPPFMTIATATRVVDAVVGEFTYEIALSGVSIRSSGLNGPYFENLCIWTLPDPGQMVKVSYTSNNSRSYLSTDFQSRAVIAVTGTVFDVRGNTLSAATVAFVNYTDLTYDQAITNPLGGYSENLHLGDFVCVVTEQGRTADNATLVTVTGTGPYDFRIQDPIATAYDTSIVMSGENIIDWRMIDTRDGALSSTRMLIDWNFGNRDGYVSAEESALYGRSNRRPLPADDTFDGLHVDGAFYYPTTPAASVLEFDYSGPVLSDVPMIVEETTHLESNSPIPVRVDHVVEVNVSYDSPARQGRVTLRLPPRWIATGSNAVANVSVSGIGTRSVFIDPLGNPNPSGNPYSAWVSIATIDTSHIPPTVQGQTASPDPQEFMQPVHISAWVNDSSPIDSVTIDITAPQSGPLGKFTMAYDSLSKRFDYDLESYPDLGTYSFTVWATDTDGNRASGGGAFVVRDTTAPIAEAGPDRTVSAGTQVTLDGGGSTDDYGVSNWTWEFVDGATNVTLYGTVATHAFNTVGSYLVTVTARDSSGNQGTDSMTVEVKVGGNLGRFAEIQTSWILVIMLLNDVCFILAAALSFAFARWNRILRHAPLGNIATGFGVLAASFAIAAAFQAVVASGPSPHAGAMLLATLSLQTLAFSFLAAGYGLWKRDTKATWTTILLGSLLVLAAVLAAVCALVPSLLGQIDFSAMMRMLYGINFALLSFIAVTTLRRYIGQPQTRAASVPAAFGILSLGQCSLLVFSFDGGIASIMLASITTLIGLVFLWRMTSASRRASVDG